MFCSIFRQTSRFGTLHSRPKQCKHVLDFSWNPSWNLLEICSVKFVDTLTLNKPDWDVVYCLAGLHVCPTHLFNSSVSGLVSSHCPHMCRRYWLVTYSGAASNANCRQWSVVSSGGQSIVLCAKHNSPPVIHIVRRLQWCSSVDVFSLSVCVRVDTLVSIVPCLRDVVSWLPPGRAPHEWCWDNSTWKKWRYSRPIKSSTVTCQGLIPTGWSQHSWLTWHRESQDSLNVTREWILLVFFTQTLQWAAGNCSLSNSQFIY